MADPIPAYDIQPIQRDTGDRPLYLSTEDILSESWWFRHYQFPWAQTFAVVLWHLWGAQWPPGKNGAPAIPVKYDGARPYVPLNWTDDYWHDRKGGLIEGLRTDIPWRILLTNMGYTGDTKETIGDENILQSNPKSLRGKAWYFDRTEADTEGAFKHSERVELTQERKVTTEQELHFDVTNTLTVKAESSGIGFENALQVAFGQSWDTTKEESESKAREDTEEIEEPLPAHEESIVKLGTNDVLSTANITVDGAMTWGVDAQVPPSDANRGVRLAGGTEYIRARGNPTEGLDAWKTLHLSFPTLDDAIEWVEGFNVDWPGMRGYLQDPETPQYVLDAVAWLKDQTNRTVQFKARQEREYEGSVTVKTINVTGQDAATVREHYGVQN